MFFVELRYGEVSALLKFLAMGLWGRDTLEETVDTPVSYLIVE